MPDDLLRSIVIKQGATTLARIRRVDDEMVRLCDLPESGAAVSGLAANAQARLAAQTPGPLDFLSGPVERRRQVGVMRVALDTGGATVNGAFEFVEAGAELMVKLTLFDHLIALLCERALDALQLLALKGDDQLGLTDQLCASIFELIFEAVNDTDDSLNPLIIKPLDVSIAVHG